MKNNALSVVFTFSLGAAVGSIVTWKLVKTKYEQIADEEIASVKEVYSRKINNASKVEVPNSFDVDDDEPLPIKITEPEALEECDKVIEEAGYERVNYSDISRKTEPKTVSEAGEPYVITPEEFGEKDDYEQVSLTYYSDGVLTDDMDEPIEDIDRLVGRESLTHFGEYEDDSVFVRNDELERDYEILYDTRAYAAVMSRGPRQSEDE